MLPGVTPPPITEPRIRGPLIGGPLLVSEPGRRPRMLVRSERASHQTERDPPRRRASHSKQHLAHRGVQLIMRK